jgi:hypothetical protein
MLVNATFRAASPQDAERIVRLMQGNYAEAGYAFDARAARCAVDGLLSRPEFRQVWCVEVAGEIAGYFVLALGYSFEFRGVDAFLDALSATRLPRKGDPQGLDCPCGGRGALARRACLASGGRNRQAAGDRSISTLGLQGT